MTILNGLTQIRISMEDISKESFKNMSAEELKLLIHKGLLNTRKKAYVYDANNFGTDTGIELNVDFKESDNTEPVTDGNLRIVALVEIPEKVSSDWNLSELDLTGIEDFTVKIKGNSFGCMNSLGYQTFQFPPEVRGNKEIYILSLDTNDKTNFKGGLPVNLELYKNMSVFVLNEKKECIYSINNLDNEIRLDEKYNMPQDVWVFFKKALQQIFNTK